MVVRLPRRFAPRNDISRGPSPQVPCNEADAVRSACLNGKKMAIKMKAKTNKNISVVIFFKSMYILEIKTKD
jgi:hypothetical protein